MHYYPLAALSIAWIFYLWETYLDYRQYKVYINTDKVPGELEDIIRQDTLVKAKSYKVDRAQFSFVTGLLEQIQTTATITLFLLPYFWTLSGKALSIAYQSTDPTSLTREILQSIIFIFITSVLSNLINLPQSIYSTFVIEERHGFNKQTAGFYAWDKLKKFIVSFLITAPITAAMIYIVRIGGDNFFYYLWLFGVVISCVLIFFEREISGLFDTFTAMPKGELRDKIEKLASQVNFPLQNIFIVDGSKRSAHSNAYQTGIFNKKRIVIYDTLLKPKQGELEKEEETTHDEILAVLCHELGHWYHGHLWRQLALAQTNFFLIFMMFSKFYTNDEFYAGFGFGEKPVIIGIMLMLMILTPYNELIGFISILMSRKFEYQSDQFAKQRGYAGQLKSALIKLNTSNLGFPVHDELYSTFNNSHPTLIERMKALDKTD